MTAHINAKAGDFAPTVIMPGDPLRAKFIAENFLDTPKQYTSVRNILGFTGTYKGVPVSVQGTGMGIPSISIYATELYRFYGVRRIVRVGTCGGMASSVKVGDTVIGTCAHTNASLSTLLVPGVNLSWAASYPMLRGAMDAAQALTDAPVHAGPVYSSDLFYLGRADIVQGLTALGTLGVEMEAAGLYAAAAQEGAEALTVLTVSDHLVDGSNDMTAQERETLYATSVKVGAAALLA